jgi:uncharacterized protein YodC (DUF2158 family)
MNQQFKVGDIVRLKSGSPTMTVTELKPWNGTQTAWCAWFEAAEANKGSWPVDSLELAGI